MRLFSILYMLAENFIRMDDAGAVNVINTQSSDHSCKTSLFNYLWCLRYPCHTHPLTTPRRSNKKAGGFCHACCDPQSQDSRRPHQPLLILTQVTHLVVAYGVRLSRVRMACVTACSIRSSMCKRGGLCALSPQGYPESRRIG